MASSELPRVALQHFHDESPSFGMKSPPDRFVKKFANFWLGAVCAWAKILAREWYEEVSRFFIFVSISSLGRYGNGFAHKSGY